MLCCVSSFSPGGHQIQKADAPKSRLPMRHQTPGRTCLPMLLSPKPGAALEPPPRSLRCRRALPTAALWLRPPWCGKIRAEEQGAQPFGPNLRCETLRTRFDFDESDGQNGKEHRRETRIAKEVRFRQGLNPTEHQLTGCKTQS